MYTKMPHWLTKQAYLHPEKPALEWPDGRKLTFLELKEASERLAKKLANLSIGKGTRVAILSRNSFDMIAAIHALSYLEALIVFLNVRLTEQELMYQLEKSKAKILLGERSLLEEKRLAFPKQYTFEDIHSLSEKEVRLTEVIDLTAPFTMMYTSGTTGFPKGVIHTYGNHWFSAIGSVLNLGLDDDDKWLLTLPMFHVGGLSILIRSVTYGMTVFFMEKYDVKTLKEALYEKKVTIASLVTLMLQQLLDEIGEEPFPEHVRCLLLGGGGIPEPVLERAVQKQMPVFLSYGMTETSSQIVTLSAAYIRKKIGSAGKPLFPASVKIDNPDEEGIGEILVKGPMVFHGYDEMPDVNEQVFKDGWFHTGDLGYLDEDGFLYVVDRRSDLIISGGENIYPSEVEQVLMAYPGVKEAAVVGKRDARWGEVPVAFVVAKDAIAEDALIEFVRRKIASYKAPREIIFVDRLPRNASNKIMRRRLKEQLG
mgnify:FL=1